MSVCPKKTACPLFPKFVAVENLRVWQTHYCDGRFEACERYRMSSAGVRPDDDMLPNGKKLGPVRELRIDDVVTV